MNNAMNNEKIKNTDNKIDELNNKIDELDNKLNIILNILNKIEPNCDKMSNHIDLIDKIYEKAKYPLGYIIGNFNYMLGKEEYHLIDKK